MNTTECLSWVDQHFAGHILLSRDRRKKIVRLTLEAKSAGRTDAETFAYVRERMELSPLAMLLLGVLINAIIKLAIEWWLRRRAEGLASSCPSPPGARGR